jgi:hypothetical protein
MKTKDILIKTGIIVTLIIWISAAWIALHK